MDKYTIIGGILNSMNWDKKGQLEPKTHSLYTHTPVGMRLSLPYWILAFIGIQIVWITGGGILTHAGYLVLYEQLISGSIVAQFLLQNINFFILLFLLWIFIRYVLNISCKEFMTDADSFRTMWALWSAVIWVIGTILFFGIGIGVGLTHISFVSHSRIRERVILILLTVSITPLQCLAEELLYRTMIWRMLRTRIKSNSIIAGISALFFASAHVANAEIVVLGSPVLVLGYYALVGFLFMYITCEQRGTEIVLGFHIANNLFIALFIGYRGSSLPSIPIILLDRPSILLDMGAVLTISLLILFVIRRSSRNQIPFRVGKASKNNHDYIDNYPNS